jgi:hypothetical protein
MSSEGSLEGLDNDPVVVPIDKDPALTFRAWIESLPERERCDPGVDISALIGTIRDSGEH